MSSEATHNQLPWYILGAGAIGCLWASYWRQAGFTVVLITRSEKKKGIIDLHVEDRSTQTPIEQITVDQLLASKTVINQLFVSTKAHQAEQALLSILPCLRPDAKVLVVQNGMAVKKLKGMLATQTLYTGITTDGAYRIGELAVVHASNGTTYIDCEASLLKQLPAEFLSIHPCDDIEHRQWQKLVINCAINGLTAIYQCRNGELFNNAEALQRMDAICEEAHAVAATLGIHYKASTLRDLVTETLTLTADNYSSTHQDIMNGRSTEIGLFNGYLCERAATAGLPCEENQRVLTAVMQLETSSSINKT